MLLTVQLTTATAVSLFAKMVDKNTIFGMSLSLLFFLTMAYIIVEIFSFINESYMKRHKNTTYTNTSTVPIWIGPLGLDLPTTMALVSHYCLLVGKFIPKVDYKFKVF